MLNARSSIRREWLNHIIIFKEAHLRRVLPTYVASSRSTNQERRGLRVAEAFERLVEQSVYLDRVPQLQRLQGR
jgi:hypothetical protein